MPPPPPPPPRHTEKTTPPPPPNSFSTHVSPTNDNPTEASSGRRRRHRGRRSINSVSSDDVQMLAFIADTRASAAGEALNEEEKYTLMDGSDRGNFSDEDEGIRAQSVAVPKPRASGKRRSTLSSIGSQREEDDDILGYVGEAKASIVGKGLSKDLEYEVMRRHSLRKSSMERIQDVDDDHSQVESGYDSRDYESEEDEDELGSEEFDHKRSSNFAVKGNADSSGSEIDENDDVDRSLGTESSEDRARGEARSHSFSRSNSAESFDRGANAENSRTSGVVTGRDLSTTSSEPQQDETNAGRRDFVRRASVESFDDSFDIEDSSDEYVRGGSVGDNRSATPEPGETSRRYRDTGYARTDEPSSASTHSIQSDLPRVDNAENDQYRTEQNMRRSSSKIKQSFSSQVLEELDDFPDDKSKIVNKKQEEERENTLYATRKELHNGDEKAEMIFSKVKSPSNIKAPEKPKTVQPIVNRKSQVKKIKEIDGASHDNQHSSTRRPPISPSSKKNLLDLIAPSASLQTYRRESSRESDSAPGVSSVEVKRRKSKPEKTHSLSSFSADDSFLTDSRAGKSQDSFLTGKSRDTFADSQEGKSRQTKRSKRSHRAKESLPSHRSHRHHRHRHRSGQRRGESSKPRHSDETNEGPMEKSIATKEWELFLHKHSFAGDKVDGGTTKKMAPVPSEVRTVFARVRGGEPLPRESVVQNVVRHLTKTNSEEETPEDTGGICVAIMPEMNSENVTEKESDNHPKSIKCIGGGVGKTTVAALVCVRGDIRTRYRHGLAWLNIEKRQQSMDYEAYCKTLKEICIQLGIQPQKLKLSPFIRSPCEDEAVAKCRIVSHMKEAFESMGHLLMLHCKKYSSGEDARKVKILIVLDNLIDESEVGWFLFRDGNDGYVINDVLVTSNFSISGVKQNVVVPPLNTRESIRLLLMESHLSNHTLAKNSDAFVLVKKCLHHPLTIKFVGRWMNLKRVTAGGQKGVEEIIKEINSSLGEIDDSVSFVEVLFTVLSQASSPLVRGTRTKIVKLCFAAFVLVFGNKCNKLHVSQDIADGLFMKVVETESDILAKEDPLFQSHGRHATKLVPEILGALGVFNIIKHSTVSSNSGKPDSSIEIEYDLVHMFGEHLLRNDETMRCHAKNAELRWNEAYVKSYYDIKGNFLWDDSSPNRMNKYALQYLPTHLIRAEMFEDAEALIRNETYIRGRCSLFGWTEATRAHVKDAEDLWAALRASKSYCDASVILLATFEQLESMLKEEVTRNDSNSSCSNLEAGRCLHEISLSFAKIGLWKESSRFCDSCLSLVAQNIWSSELIASLFYNSSVVHMEINELDLAEKKIEECLNIRAKAVGLESTLYLKGLNQLGCILSKMRAFRAAEDCFAKVITASEQISGRCGIDYGTSLYKMGRIRHKQGRLDEAMKFYERALDCEKIELGLHHVFVANTIMQIADVFLVQDDCEQAKRHYEHCRDVLSHGVMTQRGRIILCVAIGKLLGLSDRLEEAVKKYEEALSLIREDLSPRAKLNEARTLVMMGLEYEKKLRYDSSERCFEDSIAAFKSALGPMYLDVAEVLVNLARVKIANQKHVEAAECLEEAMHIQKTKLGDGEEVANTLCVYASCLKACGDFENAETAYHGAMQMIKSMGGGKESVSLVGPLLGMADLMNAIGEYDEASEYYVECLEIQKVAFGKIHDSIANTLYAMGLVKHNQRNFARSVIFFKKSADIRVKLHGETHPSVGDTYNMMGFVEANNGNLDESLRCLENALKVRKMLGDRLKEAETLLNIGHVHREKDQFELAVENYDDCISIRIAELGANDATVAEAHMALGNVKSDMKLLDEALSSYNEALQIMESVHGKDNPRLGIIFEKMGMLQFRSGSLVGAKTSRSEEH
ncbi:hypothetical protein ACHAXS_010979, partial [Conticribra weissflogii]